MKHRLTLAGYPMYAGQLEVVTDFDDADVTGVVSHLDVSFPI